MDDIIISLSALTNDMTALAAGGSCIVLDEIQECPEARTALKFFHLDGRFDVIGTGSLLGVSGYGKEPSSIPVGYETILDMYPMDFEEFLWAQGIPDEVIGKFTSCLEELKPIPESIHERMFQLLLQLSDICLHIPNDDFHLQDGDFHRIHLMSEEKGMSHA